MTTTAEAPWQQTLAHRLTSGNYAVGVFNDRTREGDGIATVYGSTAGHAWANACLIAAAPDLLAALEALFTAVGETLIDYGSVEGEAIRAETHDVMEQARAAIARAKGNS